MYSCDKQKCRCIYVLSYFQKDKMIYLNSYNNIKVLPRIIFFARNVPYSAESAS